MKISFIIPVFDTAVELFDKCIQSVLNIPDPAGAEIIVCDDGSNLLFFQQYQRICERHSIRLLRLHSHLGMAVARNYACSKATGEYLFFVDSDDEIATSGWSVLLEVMNDRPPLIIADHANCDYNGNVQTIRKKAFYKSFIDTMQTKIDSPFFHATFLFHPFVVRRDVFFDCGQFPLDYSSGEEVDLHIKIAAKYGEAAIRFLPVVLYHYRKNPSSVVHDAMLYKALIGNIEDIIARNVMEICGLAVAAHRSGRSQLTGTAHYRLTNLKTMQTMEPSWYTTALCIE